MRIGKASVTENAQKITVSADITFSHGEQKTAFFSLDTKYKDFIHSDSSAFLAAFLLPSMKMKEPLHVEGVVSKKLSTSLPQIQKLVSSWNVGFEHVDVSKTDTIEDTKKGSFVGCFFTAGVDSFYTFLKHKKDITHLIFLHGSDISLQNDEFFQEAAKHVEQIAKEAGINFLFIDTNLRDVIEEKLEWEWEIGSALSATALLMRNGFKRIYIPSGMRFDQVCAYGTHPKLDPLFSTEVLEIVHDGCEAGRLEKVFAIAKSPIALKHLRVCCFTLKGKYNCNECMKCVQTKIDLLCANALQDAETFDKKIDLAVVKRTYYDNALNFHLYAEEALTYLKQTHREQELQKALAYSLLKSKKLPLTRRIASYVALLDKKYNKRRIYKTIFGLTDSNDRNFMFKSLAAMGLIK